MSARIMQHRGLVLITLAFLVLAWTYGLVLPPFENLDEIEHFSAIRYVADTGKLPVHDPVLQEQYRYRQEASQPPLYYVLLGGVVRLLDLPTEDTNAYLVYNPFVACGSSEQPYNRHILYHNPVQEAYPWRGALLTLHLLRALSPLLQVVTVVGVYASARLILPRRPGVALLAAALSAFNPQFLLVASGVNNDNLVTPLATLGIYFALLTRQRGLSLRRALGLGLLAGLAGLAKLSGLLLLPFVALILLEMLWRSRNNSSRPCSLANVRQDFGPQGQQAGRGTSSRAGRGTSSRAGRGTHHVSRITYHVLRITLHGLLTAAAAAAVSGWWFWRNWQLYGDLTALEPMLDLVGRRPSSGLPLNETGLMFKSFWGQLACAFYGGWFYLFFGLLTAAGLVGLLGGLWNERNRVRWGLFFLALWFGVTYAGWLRWGSLTAATGGRLLFPAIASTSVLLAYGLGRLWPTRWQDRASPLVAVILAGVALVTLQWEIRPLFSPPPTYPETDAPAIPHPLEADFGAAVRLQGYEAQVQGRPPYLDVTLYWQAGAALSQDYALAIQLTSPVPGDDSLRLNYNTWPGRGLYPTAAWSPGEIIADDYHLRLPASDAPTQAWQLLVALYERESGERLPVRLDDQAVGNGLVLTTLRVPGRRPDCPDKATLAQPVRFGEIIALTGATVSPAPESLISLCWESLAPTSTDYTVLVHLYDEGGELLTTGDGPPMGGAFPTRLWQPGDVIADKHTLSIPTAKGDHRLGVGLYNPASGERLPAAQAGQPLPNGIYFLEE